MSGSNKSQAETPERKSKPVVSACVPGQKLVELIYDPEKDATAFAVGDKAGWALTHSVETGDGGRLTPYAPDNDLIQHGVVKFPSGPEEYGDTAQLLEDIRGYLHRYIDVSETFEALAAYYALFSWVHDRFNELPYLRLRGDYGSGKTRFLLVLGSICYKPIFAGGASTVSPLFHMLDRFGGTLLIDEADFRFSDEKAQIAKILNNGNVRGFSVLRSESPNGREYRPRAYQVFGPKIIAMRGRYEDAALESRFLTEESGARRLRSDIPINLPADQETEALTLRNKLLLYRFRNHARLGDCARHLDSKLEPRMNQIFAPLRSIIEDDKARTALTRYARAYQKAVKEDRGDTLEADALALIRHLSEDAAAVTVGDVAQGLSALGEGGFVYSGRAAGAVIRNRLGLRTRKSHGVFVIAPEEMRKLPALYERYGVGGDEAEQAAARMTETQKPARVEFGDDPSLPDIR